MAANKILVAFAIVLLSFGGSKVASAQGNSLLVYKDKPAHIIIQSSGLHSFRLRISNTAGDENIPPDNPAFLKRNWGKSISINNGKATVNGLSILIQYNPLTIHIKNPNGVIQTFMVDPKTGVLSFDISDGPVLGLGEGSEKLDKRGAFYAMKQGQVNPNAKKWVASIPVPFLIGTKGWAFFIATPGGQFDLTGKTGKFIPAADATDAPLDLIFFDAGKPLEMMNEITQLVGKPVLPPKWAMGYMQSHRTLQNTAQMIGIVDSFRKKQLPLDAVIYLGTGFTPRGWNLGHNSIDFNPKVFDIAPKDFIGQMHQRHVKVILHVVPPTIGGKLQLLGAIPALKTEVEDSTSISAYWRKHESTFSLGVDGWWPDEGDAYTVKSLFLRHEMYYKGPLTDRPNERPWNLQRNGYLGVARYGGYIWSGDVRSNWETLTAQIAVGLNYSLTVSPYWGTDNGGFLSTKELTGELYTRWFEFSAFCPSFRSHGRTWNLRLPWGWNTGSYGVIEDGRNSIPDTSELHNAKVEPITRKYLDLRYQLLPYNYTTAREAHDKGLPMMRALWLYYPHDSTAVKQSGEYLWGRDMLIAPVTEKGVIKREVYLPKGEWYNWWTNKKETGGQTIICDADLSTLPIYVKAGAIIPLDPVRQYIDQPVTGATVIKIFDSADGNFILYDDDGKTQDYLKGKGSWTEFAWNNKTGTLVIKPRAGSTSTIKAKNYWVQLISSGKEKAVKYTGKIITTKI